MFNSLLKGFGEIFTSSRDLGKFFTVTFLSTVTVNAFFSLLQSFAFVSVTSAAPWPVFGQITIIDESVVVPYMCIVPLTTFHLYVLPAVDFIKYSIVSFC